MSPAFNQSVSWTRNCQRHLALAIAGLSRKILLATGRAASSMPGRAGLKIYPDLLTDLSKNRQVVLVSGTNGKTSTVHMLEHMLRAAGKEVVSNSSGANMPDGILSSLVASQALLKQSSSDQELIFVFEVDEAWMPAVAEATQAQICVITNIFRDQLDRYGELTKTRSYLLEGLQKTQALKAVVLCGDDPLVSSMASEIQVKALFFGLRHEAMAGGQDPHLSEAAYCPICRSPLEYERYTYSHLGQYHCTKCSFVSPESQMIFTPVTDADESGRASFHYNGEEHEVKAGIPGMHNLYNAAAALLTAMILGCDFHQSAEALSDVKPGYGRMESFVFDGNRHMKILLVKNPVGVERSLRYALSENPGSALFFLINDKDNDGRDLSWLWDVDFSELLENQLDKTPAIVCSGTRAEEMALRLHYAGVPDSLLFVEREAKAALKLLLGKCPEGTQIYAFPNYTAMLALRSHLAGKGGIES